ncbi:MAG TPA: DUF1634 domain-containing protein [Terriglobales bacterium]|nr:DUF1634 domain-containing protein [Terriglobales bacterium]
MPLTPTTPTREAPANVYSAVYKALLWGMVVSTVLYALGVGRALWQGTTITLGPVTALGWGAVLAGALRLDASCLMQLATVVLILTPVARVVLALVAFWRDRDYRFVIVTGIVLAVIGLTVVLGRLGLH